ncbi:MAG TPA: hypothetical protein VGD89_08645 [Flavipsychrobacter sp.]
MRILYTVLLFILFAIKSHAQADTAKRFVYEGRSHVALHVDAGWNKAWFQGLGLSYIYVSAVEKEFPATFVLYAAGEINEAKSTNAIPFYYGYKAGIEFAYGTVVGIELRNLTDFKGNGQFIATPRIGLSAFSLMQITYGYNLFNTQKNTFLISTSQFTLSFNIPFGVFKRYPRTQAQVQQAP